LLIISVINSVLLCAPEVLSGSSLADSVSVLRHKLHFIFQRCATA